jgi:steroid delta-isomerase-like uncharacterized protein
MSSQDAKAVVHRYLQEFVSGGNVAAAERLVADDVVFTSPYTSEPVHGSEPFIGMIMSLRAAFPDPRIDEHDAIAEGDMVAARWTASGTHTGEPFADMPAGRRRFEIEGMSFYRVRDGRVVEGWVNDDSLGMLTQLGALGTPMYLLHHVPGLDSRPRGFEPLTFGSVDRRGSAIFGSGKPNPGPSVAKKAPKNQDRGLFDRPWRLIEQCVQLRGENGTRQLV